MAISEEEMNLLKVLRSGGVIRYHSTLIDEKQRIDSHHWEAAMILQAIYPECSKDLLFYALTHDCAEIYTSDVAAPVKRMSAEIKKILKRMEEQYEKEELELNHPKFTEEEIIAVKYADIISGIYFTTYRVNCGDREALPIRAKWIEYYESLPQLYEPFNENCDQLIKEILL